MVYISICDFDYYIDYYFHISIKSADEDERLVVINLTFIHHLIPSVLLGYFHTSVNYPCPSFGLS